MWLLLSSIGTLVWLFVLPAGLRLDLQIVNVGGVWEEQSHIGFCGRKNVSAGNEYTWLEWDVADNRKETLYWLVHDFS